VRECPCGSGEPYDACCARYHRGEARPGTAEQLMRSRYSAYVFGDQAYLLLTWHSSTRPPSLGLGDPTGVKWLGLRIRAVEAGGPGDQEGIVSFVARCKVSGRAHRVEETSRFVCEAGQWVYVDGDVEC
jgi:SEC-C motif domain protein